MTTIKLTKMQGCGNDFVILDYDEYKKTGMPMLQNYIWICMGRMEARKLNR